MHTYIRRSGHSREERGLFLTFHNMTHSKGQRNSHRAAISNSRVGLKHHVGVHRQLSVPVQVNLQAGADDLVDRPCAMGV